LGTLNPAAQAPEVPRHPLLKWPGGKRKLAATIARFLPDTFGTYFEPFFGGGAVFFWLRPGKAVLSDVNPNLIQCYEAIRDDPERVIEALSRLKNSRADYYHIRGTKPRTQHAAAARLIYLCTYSFNGIYRENRRGEYNVPYGYKLTHAKPTPAAIRAVSHALMSAELSARDFSHVEGRVQPGDLVYFDPPYTLKHSNNGFIKYNAALFTWRDQERLAEFARAMSDKGVHVVVSNASHPSIRSLYNGFREVIIDRHSVIAAASEGRARVSESLFVSV